MILDQLRDLAEQRQTTEHEFRRLLLEARNAGHSLAEIARAVGCSRQAIWYLTQKERTP
jgi:biotin operon repressor